MRFQQMSLLTILFAFALTAQQPASAPSPRPACDGNVTTVRVSAIIAGGSMEGFLKAVAAHKEWFQSHGQPGHEIFATRIIVRDEATRKQTYSEKEVMTYHILPVTAAPESPHDAAYDAFVKLYQQNSEIKQQYNVCMPKPGAR